MGDSKTSYTTTVSRVKKASESSKALTKKLNGGQMRASKYKDSWQNVNINDIVAKFAPCASHYESGGKVIFSNGGRYIIVADVAGGYLRIKDTSHKGKVFVTIDGKYRQDFSNQREFHKRSHYRILKREEM